MTGCRVTRKQRVLFLCRDNAALSIVAEALLRELDRLHFDAFSAGLEPADKVHDGAWGQLRHGFSSLDLLNPKSWMEFTSAWAPQMDFVITMCASSEDVDIRAFHGTPKLLHWPVPNPLVRATDGADVAPSARPFDHAFWHILKRVDAFIASHRMAWPTAIAATTAVACVPQTCECVSGR